MQARITSITQGIFSNIFLIGFAGISRCISIILTIVQGFSQESLHSSLIKVVEKVVLFT